MLDASNSGPGRALGLNDGHALVLEPPLAGGSHAGPVLIGTTAAAGSTVPATTFPFMLEVNGAVLSKEFVVFTQWPDYVFDKNYHLRSLSTLEQEIDTLKHLPEMPSASEVSTSGVRIGDVSARLLQKVEELTLYVIQINKENEALRTRVDLLERQKP